MKKIIAVKSKPHRLVDAKFIIFLFLVAFAVNSAWALEPPPEGAFDVMARSGETASRLEFAKQLKNQKIDSFLLKRAINKEKRRFLEAKRVAMSEIERIAPVKAPPPSWQGMPTTGNVKILALLIEFKDQVHTNNASDIHNNLFGTGNAARFPYESVAQYYTRASYNQLDLSSGTTLGWYKTSYNRSSVSTTRTGREKLLKEVLDHFNDQGHDFAQYDNNNDGVIDYFVVIWTGPDTGWSTFWWGYQTVFSDTSYQLDGKRLGKYSWQWEARPVGGNFTPIVVIHETGHALGLPDYYDYDPGTGPRGGVGGLDMMDANRGDHTCFSKWMLDWIEPTVVANGSHDLALKASGTAKDCVIVWPDLTTGKMFSEFFVVQNRHRVGNDQTPQMPADGMLIWHVDATLDDTGQDFKYDNSFTEHKLLRLMEADGLEEIETGADGADSGDYYVEGKAFGPATTPSSKKYDGTDTEVTVNNISASGLQMKATFQIGQNGPPPSEMPLAFGVVYSNGRKMSGTPNWSSTYNDVYKRYEIKITGENYYYLRYSTNVTPAGDLRFCKTDSVGGNLLVMCYDKNGNPAPSRFGFVTYQKK
jgi:M6 family metalloprotease-like protein